MDDSLLEMSKFKEDFDLSVEKSEIKYSITNDDMPGYDSDPEFHIY